MKKVMFGLCALMMCFFIAACGGNNDKEKGDNDEKDLKALIDELKNAKDWDEDRFVEFFNDFLDAEQCFLETNPSAEEISEFNKLTIELGDILSDLEGEQQEAMNKAESILRDDRDFQNKQGKIIKLWEETMKKVGSIESEPVEEEMNDSLRNVYDDYYDEYDDLAPITMDSAYYEDEIKH